MLQGSLPVEWGQGLTSLQTLNLSHTQLAGAGLSSHADIQCCEG